MEKYTAIAKTGTFRDSEGRRRTFTQKDLEKIAGNYNASETDAPLVIGHVKSDSAPAYGWVEKLFCENDKLFAQFSYVSDDVKNLVYKGSYKNVSMSVDMENHRLLHVALLGAAAPAIDGLGAINLSSDNGVNILSMENNENTQEEKQMDELKQKIAELEKQLLDLKAELQKTAADKEWEKFKIYFAATGKGKIYNHTLFTVVVMYANDDMGIITDTLKSCKLGKNSGGGASQGDDNASPMSLELTMLEPIIWNGIPAK